MNTTQHEQAALLQWEGLQVPRRIIRLDLAGNLLAGSSAATISRNDSYCLRCEVEGFASQPFAPNIEFQSKRGGPFAFSGLCGGYTVSLSNCYLTRVESRLDSDSGLYKHNSFQLGVHTDRVEQKATGKWNETTHIDWFLNGPRTFIWPQETHHQRDLGYLRKIDGHPEFVLACSTSLPGAHADCALVRLPGFSFVLREVPEELGPYWSKNLGIEYSTKLSAVPDPDTREAVAEIVSFVLGRRLIDVGDTTLATHDSAIHMQNWDPSKGVVLPAEIKPDFPFCLRSWNPRGINVRALCSQIDFPPIPIDRQARANAQNIEGVLAGLVPVYLKRRRELALDDALWRYWTFQELPLGVNLPMLVTGIEILAAAWFDSPASASHGNFTSKKEFLALLEDDFKTMRAKLAGAAKLEPSMAHLQNQGILDKLMQRIENSFQMGPTARTRAFFQELGVTPTVRQLESLEARHGQIHSHGAHKEPAELWSLSENLRTLFYTIMLRLLDYSGEYLDWAEQKPAAKLLGPLRPRNGVGPA
jgi:hypothetical protein